MSDYLIIFFRTVFLYIILLIIFRLMGKREVGELSVMDLAIFVLIAEVAAFALDDIENKLFESILPILSLLVLQVGTSYISLKSKKFRDLIDGDPTVVIRDGIILEKEMRKQRYNLDDLLQQLREQSISSVEEVAFAYLEPSGNLSVYQKNEERFAYPLVIDGDIQERHLLLIKKDKQWLFNKLEEKGFNNVKDVFYCSIDENDRIYILRKLSSSFKDKT